MLFTQAVYDYNSDNNITAIAELDEAQRLVRPDGFWDLCDGV